MLTGIAANDCLSAAPTKRRPARVVTGVRSKTFSILAGCHDKRLGRAIDEQTLQKGIPSFHRWLSRPPDFCVESQGAGLVTAGRCR
jgi:hypothetical protein